MSTNLKNEYREGFMRNFSNYTIDRYIIIDDNNMNDNEKDIFVSRINEALWHAIQEVNILTKHRTLPFVIVRRVVEVKEGLRIIINDFDQTCDLNNCRDVLDSLIDVDKLSHLINFKTLSPRRQIQVSDQLIPGNAKMIINQTDQIAAAVDIYLDIAMFNSFATLTALDDNKKKSFSELKFIFAKDNDLGNYYNCSLTKPPAYWSFAFSSRIDNTTIDFFKYIELWNIFLGGEYPKALSDSIAIPAYEQLNYHKDKCNFDKKYFTSEFWETHEKGDFLIIRINSDSGNNTDRMIIADYFGIKNYHVGATKTIHTQDYYIKYIYDLMKNLYISAYKIVVL